MYSFPFEGRQATVLCYTVEYQYGAHERLPTRRSLHAHDSGYPINTCIDPHGILGKCLLPMLSWIVSTKIRGCCVESHPLVLSEERCSIYTQYICPLIGVDNMFTLQLDSIVSSTSKLVEYD